MTNEIWNHVVGYEGSYSISSQGRVKSHLRNKILVQFYGSRPYLRVSLVKNKKSVTHFVHKLVAQAFLTKPETQEVLVIDHINGDKNDNRSENLRWCVQSFNLMNVKSEKVRGVSWNNDRKKWMVTFGEKMVGRFKEYQEAVNKRLELEKLYFPDLQKDNMENKK